MKTLLGKGILQWSRYERICDRYGAIYLYDDSRDPDVVPIEPRPTEGTRGKLIAQVVEVRESYHIGDLMRGLFPSQPGLGEEIVLGEGEIFYEEVDRYEAVGLRPDDGRDYDWLSPSQLYRVHEQKVELYFEEAK